MIVAVAGIGDAGWPNTGSPDFAEVADPGYSILKIRAHCQQNAKRFAEKSKRPKGTPYQSAMSMLNFYINRAGKNLPQKQKQILERAKGELREAFGRT